MINEHIYVRMEISARPLNSKPQFFPDKIGSIAGKFILVQADSTDGGFANKFTTSAGNFAQLKGRSASKFFSVFWFEIVHAIS